MSLLHPSYGTTSTAPRYQRYHVHEAIHFDRILKTVTDELVLG